MNESTSDTIAATSAPVPTTVPATSRTAHPTTRPASNPFANQAIAPTHTVTLANRAPDESHESALLHTAITDELAVAMLEGRWPIGEAMTLEDIQERFSTSRTVAREVAKYLEAMGAVTVRRRVGLMPRPVGEWSALNPQVIRWKLMSDKRKEQLRTLTELRLAVEPAATAAAARNASMEARALFPVMASELRKSGEAGDLDTFHDLDVRFHSSILLSSGNDLFASMSDIIGIVLKGRVELHMYPQKPKPAALDAHDAVAEGIWRGNPDQAREAMRTIVDEVAESLELT
ncbi:transcriptional regulator [Bifidobacterium myosotis]|uniref:Transcriptional regulator n=1 Tax=Bifidobacterium myosotis TaxID=1630166 RepID=A0A261FLV5_9BIFI|nr:FCD domain-containing protein [Bifidobacterium myosotis]OZG60129.1 transcriptional regulator [Bifidobacterium myosotis]